MRYRSVTLLQHLSVMSGQDVHRVNMVYGLGSSSCIYDLVGRNILRSSACVCVGVYRGLATESDVAIRGCTRPAVMCR